jgi:hypothetical protein
MAQEPRKPREVLRIKATAAKVPDEPTIAEEISAPTEESIRTVLDRIEEAFFSLGTDKLPGTIIPVGGRNNAKEAGEFVVAERLKKLAEERLKNASEAAEKAGVFGDPEEYKNGETVMVFSDPNFSINVKMGKPSKMINRELVETNATVFLGKKATEFLETCFMPRAATKQIIVSMK